MQITPYDCAVYAYNAGFRGDDLVTAVAIAGAESGWNTMPPGWNDGGASVGLWQVHMPSWPRFSRAQLLDPQGNANAAYYIWSLSGWYPWCSWEYAACGGHGRATYRGYLGTAQLAVTAMLQQFTPAPPIPPTPVTPPIPPIVIVPPPDTYPGPGGIGPVSEPVGSGSLLAVLGAGAFLVLALQRREELQQRRGA